MIETNCNENEQMPDRPAKPKIPPVAPHHLLPPKEEENILRRSLKEIGEDMKKMEDLITLTEDIIRRERERDREFYLRERRRKLIQNPSIPRHLFQIQKIESQPTRIAQNSEVPAAKPQSPEPVKENQSLRKRITKRFKRKSFKSEKRNSSTNSDELQAPKISQPQKSNQMLKSPTLKVNSVGKSSRKLIRFSPSRYRSRLYFRNGKIGCIDAENMSASQTNVEKTHAIVNYITSDLDYDTCVTVKRPSITSNISDILSEESSASLDDLPNSNSYFNFDYSPTESDDRGIADDNYYMNSLSDIDSFTVQPKSDEELPATSIDQVVEVIEGTVKQASIDDEMANNGETSNVPTSSDPVLLDYIDETMSKNRQDSNDKAPNSAMSNHSNIT